MRVHVLQHVPFEDIGSMASWLASHGARMSYTRFHLDPALPSDPGGFDLIIAMGGPMSVNDESVWPWLRAEKRFLPRAIERGVPVIGICLGAQLIAKRPGKPRLPESREGNRLVPDRGDAGRRRGVPVPSAVRRVPLARRDVRPSRRRRTPGAERGLRTTRRSSWERT